MATEPKQVIAPASVQKAQESPKVDAPAASAKPVFKFVKTMSPAQVVALPNGKKVVFNVSQNQRGEYSSAGVFETSDPKLAEQIREAAAKSRLYIFEQKR